MFNIDKQKFGAFVAMLRKEKGITQKELADQLFISNKAVSKWETASSVPHIDLLIPLANLLGVTVTELLMCQRIEKDNNLDTAQVEQVVKTAISYSKEEQERAYKSKSKWKWIYILSCLIAAAEVWFDYLNGHMTTGLIVSVILGASFGLYFCFIVKTKLPSYYDENQICVYTDGWFEMNLPGMSFHNGNWGKILTVFRVWSVTILLGYPVVSYIETLLFSGVLQMAVDLFLAILLTLGGLYIPVYIVGKNTKKQQNDK